MNNCLMCGKETRNKKFCSHSCSASIVNIGVRRHGKAKIIIKCFTCGKETKNPKFCSRFCSREYKFFIMVQKFEFGENIKAGKNEKTPNPLRNYLIKKYNNTCQLCGFRKQNEYSKRWIIEIDHVDGDWSNNSKSNLRVICPNCSAGTCNYKALNSGSGRTYTPTRKKI